MPWMLRLISFGNLDIKKQTNTHSNIRVVLWPRITKVCVCVVVGDYSTEIESDWNAINTTTIATTSGASPSSPASQTFHQSSVHLLVSEMSLLPYVLFDRCNWPHVTRNLFPWICLDFCNVHAFLFLLTVVVRREVLLLCGGRWSSFGHLIRRIYVYQGYVEQ